MRHPFDQNFCFKTLHVGGISILVEWEDIMGLRSFLGFQFFQSDPFQFSHFFQKNCLGD